MKQGDLIRVVRVPDGVQDSDEFKTRSTLQLYIGRLFQIVGINECGMIESGGMIESDVGEVVGKASSMESIWIEPECVTLIK